MNRASEHDWRTAGKAWMPLRFALALLAGAGSLAVAPTSEGPRLQSAVAEESAPSLFWTRWTVIAVTGEVTLQANAQAAPRPAQIGEVVADESLVATGEGGAATLQKGKDIVRLSANSAVQLPAPNTDGPWTRVVQSVGEVFFDIETRPSRQFEVETPYLTAIVKGTQFTIGVGAGQAEVAVSRGTVGVTDRSSRDSVDVTAGHTAQVASAHEGVSVADNRAGASGGRVDAAESARAVEGSIGTDQGIASPSGKAPKSAAGASPGGKPGASKQGYQGHRRGGDAVAQEDASTDEAYPKNHTKKDKKRKDKKDKKEKKKKDKKDHDAD